MVHQFHQDQLKKIQIEIVFNSFLYHVGIGGPSQTKLIFSICFLSLFRHHGSKIEKKTRMKGLAI